MLLGRVLFIGDLVLRREQVGPTILRLGSEESIRFNNLVLDLGCTKVGYLQPKHRGRGSILHSSHVALNTPARDTERAICPEFAFTVCNENLGYNMDPHS